MLNIPILHAVDVKHSSPAIIVEDCNLLMTWEDNSWNLGESHTCLRCLLLGKSFPDEPLSVALLLSLPWLWCLWCSSGSESAQAISSSAQTLGHPVAEHQFTSANSSCDTRIPDFEMITWHFLDQWLRWESKRGNNFAEGEKEDNAAWSPSRDTATQPSQAGTLWQTWWNMIHDNTSPVAVSILEAIKPFQGVCVDIGRTSQNAHSKPKNIWSKKLCSCETKEHARRCCN